MAIERAKHDGNYTCISNEAIGLDSGLSLNARGLLAFMLSLPEDWQFSVRGLVEVLPGNGKASIQNAVKELEEAGHLVRVKQRDESGKYQLGEWTVYETPYNTSSQPLAGNQPTATTRANGHNTSSQPLAGNPSAGNQPQQSKDKQTGGDERQPRKIQQERKSQVVTGVEEPSSPQRQCRRCGQSRATRLYHGEEYCDECITEYEKPFALLA